MGEEATPRPSASLPGLRACGGRLVRVRVRGRVRAGVRVRVGVGVRVRVRVRDNQVCGVEAGRRPRGVGVITR